MYMYIYKERERKRERERERQTEREREREGYTNKINKRKRERERERVKQTKSTNRNQHANATNTCMHVPTCTLNKGSWKIWRILGRIAASRDEEAPDDLLLEEAALAAGIANSTGVPRPQNDIGSNLSFSTISMNGLVVCIRLGAS